MPATRLRLRPDAYFVPDADGVALINDVGSMRIRGAGSVPLIRWTFDVLDGSRDTAELRGELPPGAAAAFDRLVAALERAGFALPVETHRPAPAWAAERYPDHLAYLGQYPGSPVDRFERLRTRRVAVLGGGALARALAGACADLGFGRVVVQDGPTVRDVIATASARDPGRRWSIVGRPADTAAELWPHDDVRTADAVLLGSDMLTPGQLTAGLPAGTPDRPVAWIARLGGTVAAVADRGEACADCLVAAAEVPPATGGPVAAPAATLAALFVGDAVFRALAGLPPRPTTVALVDELTLTTSVHPSVRMPGCARPGRTTGHRPDGPVRSDVPDPRPGPLDAEHDRIVGIVRGWTDPVTGPLREVGEDDLDQIVLAGSRCTIRLDGEPVRYLCRGVSARETRNQVVLDALAGWAARRGAAPPGAAVAAGWSTAEARYRAVLTAAATLPAAGRPDRLADPVAATGPWRPLLAVHAPCPEVVLEPLRGGLFRATAAGRTAVAASRTAAVAEALIAVVAAQLDRDTVGGTALPSTVIGVARLMPAAATWSQALDAVLNVGLPDATFTDLTAQLPFAAGGACVVACALAEPAR